MGQLKISLMAEIEKIQRAANNREDTVRELGVFILWSNPAGEAWLLEITESDAVRVAVDGEPVEVPIDENPETIEINWSHTFVIRDRQLYLTSYSDKKESLHDGAPAQKIHAALRRIRKKFSADQLRQVHVSPPAVPDAAG